MTDTVTGTRTDTGTAIDTGTAVDTVIDGPAGDLAVRSRGLRAGAPSAVVCVQGALLPGPTAFDIPLGPPDLSLLRVLAGAGHAAVTFSARGYGASTGPADPLTISTEDGMADLAAVIDHVRAVTGLDRVHLFSWSWGGRVTGRFTEAHPELVDRLVLMDPALGGNAATPELTPTQGHRANTVEEFRSRIEAVHTDPDLREEIAQYVATHHPTSPNGIGREGSLSPVAVAPERVTRPTLMVYGVDAAKAAYMKGPITREEFFARLATDDKVFAIVPAGGDYLHLQRGRHRLHRLVLEFLGGSR